MKIFNTKSKTLLWKIEAIHPLIVMLIIAIAALGFMMLYSAANGSAHPWMIKQMIRFLVGFAVMIGLAFLDVRKLMAMAYPLYIVSFSCLVGVEGLGFVGMGAQRWLDLYVFNLQPSELMKISLLLALSRYFHQIELKEILQTSTLILPIGLTLLPAVLVMRQPDLGTAMMLLMGSVIIFWIAGVQWWKFFAVGFGVAGLVPFLWPLLYDYQKKRVLVFLNPEMDPSHSGYQVCQSKIAIGSGGFWGKRYLQGSQSHLNFLPEKQTDFMFTMFAEEWGFMGSLGLLVLYSILICYGMVVGLKSRHAFGKYLAIALSSSLFLYVFINIAMVMGLLPAVGIPLPLMSYGGTAMMTTMMSLGMIFSVRIHGEARLNHF